MKARDTFVKEFVNCRSSLFGYILGVTGDFHLAEDIFQEVSIIAFRKADDFTPGTNFKAWVREIARLKMLEERRRIQKSGLVLDEELLDSMDCAFEPLEKGWDIEKEALRSCLSKLPEKLRAMISMRYEKSWSMKKIGEFLGKTAGAAQVTLSRVRASLQECIQKFISQEEV